MPGCKNNADNREINRDNDLNTKDKNFSDSVNLGYDVCYENFFRTLPRFKDSLSAYLLLEHNERKTLTQFFTDEFMSPVSQYGMKDLDEDGIQELIIFNYTGGAHCCDEFHIFQQKQEKEFELKAHIMGGHACIDAITNMITYSFSEILGYFYSCYACAFRDGSGSFKSMREIKLKYKTSKLETVIYDKSEESQNLANLKILQRHGFEKVEAMMDNGWRKEFAMNLAIWHYNHGKQWKDTKKLFNQYYTFIDAPKVWKEFYQSMMEAAKQNSF